jgi:uncharacterized glyoxalase superfamily protein PhnB
VLSNRTMPEGALIPVLSYPSVPEAIRWLGTAFGFALRWQIGEHRAQVEAAPGCAVAITAGDVVLGADHVMVRVPDAAAHRDRAQAAGAEVGDLADHMYGERQYTARDHAGRTWVFTESIADVEPAEWGATTGPGR